MTSTNFTALRRCSRGFLIHDRDSKFTDAFELDAQGAQVVVHGDNGVVLDGATQACGTRFHWRTGTTLVLEAASGDGPACTLRLEAPEAAEARLP